MKPCHVIAVDLGAESGRVMDVRFDGETLAQTEIRRFDNTPVCAQNTLYWDILRLWHEIQTGIAQVPGGASSVGVDTWGVDFGLLDQGGNLLGNPVHYRDTRTDGLMQWVFERVPRSTIFARTGIQFMQLNTLYQMASLVKNHSPLLDLAQTYLSIPDLLTYWLSGEIGCEFTHATTTQMFNPQTGDWDRETMAALGFPTTIFPAMIPPGSQRGSYKGLKVIAPTTHDTASAVVAVPTTTENFAYLSSGTWSLLGLEVSQPIINEAAAAANVTNEGGFANTFRFLKNVQGLWMIQQCRATWAAEGTNYSYDQLTIEAGEAEPFRSLIDPDAAEFLAPGDMPSRIRAFCRQTDQPEPETVGQMTRAIFESLALKYRVTLDKLVELANKSVDRLHIIGGGGRNKLLCQMTADATGREVLVGPYEATALGNAIVQLIALGEIESLAQARAILSRTQQIVHFKPQPTTAWDEALSRFIHL
ncbi:MAG TPA: rhamnulokinase family protein, partial [Aggregatilineaceae bacterium]|nr:rhamnulokinase family protein [Aggregatilineaceae bacterium]